MRSARRRAHDGPGRSKEKGPPIAGLLLQRTSSRVLNPDESVRFLHDHFAARDLGRIGKCRLQLLLAHPGGCDAVRLVGLHRRVEEVDGAHDAVVGLDEVVTLEAWHLAQTRQKALADLLGQLLRAALVDALVPSDGGMHLLLLTVTIQAEEPAGCALLDALGPGVTV